VPPSTGIGSTSEDNQAQGRWNWWRWCDLVPLVEDRHFQRQRRFDVIAAGWGQEDQAIAGDLEAVADHIGIVVRVGRLDLVEPVAPNFSPGKVATPATSVAILPEFCCWRYCRRRLA